MKIGILTFPHSPSFGASLQMFALYSTVKNLGHSPEIINYQNVYMRKRQHMENNKIKILLTKIISLKTTSRFNVFEKQMFFYPKTVIGDSEKLKQLSVKYDYIIVGSDQVWNPGITGSDLSYFLNFCDNCKKISYAASFGVSQLDNKFEQDIRGLLKQIPSLSIREQAGAEIVRKITGRTIPVVLDPSFLLNKESWYQSMSKEKLINRAYIFSFIFNPNDQNSAFLNELSRKTGLPILMVSDNPLRRSTNNHIFISGVAPKEFLRLIYDAQYVITDSFHGTAFSIIFNKPFFVSLSTKTNSRLETLLSSLDLNSRIINDITNDVVEIDYKHVNGRIDKLREDSMNFLRAAILDDYSNE